MNEELDLKALKRAGYRFYKVLYFQGNVAFSYCILCGTANEINVTAVWTNYTQKRVTFYNLCKTCGDEFYSLSQNDRDSIVANVIEPKITSLPNLKTVKFVPKSLADLIPVKCKKEDQSQALGGKAN